MISIIIPTFNREESLERCIRSIKTSDLTDVEIIVIYSGRFNNTEKIVRAYKCNKNSLVEARQFGFEKAKGEIVVYIDDDVEVTKDWLGAIRDSFKDKSVGGVSGPTIVPKDELKNRDVFRLNNGLVGWFYRNIILEGREKEVGKICKSGMWTPGSNYSDKYYNSYNRYNYYIPVDYLEACNMALRRSLIEKVGGFDLEFKGTSEWCEVDLAMRVKKLGFRLVFNPKAKVFHHVSRKGVFKARENTSERMNNFLRYWFKHHKDFGGGVINFLIVLVFLNGYWMYKKLWKTT